jgi:predicted RNase H-like HicB family nuclease
MTCPSLPGCTAQGKSIEESIEQMKKTIDGRLYSVNPVNGIFEGR